MTPPHLVAVCANPHHALHKHRLPTIELRAGHGVVGDAHAGATVQHRSRKRRDPTLPNLRQVHLLHAELHDMLRTLGFPLEPGAIGENLLTRGLDLLALPRGTQLRIGDHAVVELTGLRNPCAQLDQLHPGLQRACLRRHPDRLERLAGIMAIVLTSGAVQPGDPLQVLHEGTDPLEPV